MPRDFALRNNLTIVNDPKNDVNKLKDLLLAEREKLAARIAEIDAQLI